MVTDKSKEAMKLALEALKQIDNAMPFPVAKLAQAALQKALAEQPAQQEPFGYFKAEPFGWTDCAETDEGAVALYTTSQPAQRTFVGLTDGEKSEIVFELFSDGKAASKAMYLLNAHEAKLKEKNT